MARSKTWFAEQQIDDLLLDLEAVASIPDNVMLDMLTAQGEVIAQAQKRELERFRLEDTDQLKDSISISKKLKRKSGERYITVYPRGKRTETVTKQKRVKGAKKHVSVTEHVTNSEVAFVHEYGAPRRGISAKNWMRLANEKSADEAVKASAAVYEKYLISKNL